MFILLYISLLCKKYGKTLSNKTFFKTYLSNNLISLNNFVINEIINVFFTDDWLWWQTLLLIIDNKSNQ